VTRYAASPEAARFHLARHDAGTGLSGPPLGRLARGRDFVFDPFAAYGAGLVGDPNMLVTGAIGSGKSTLVKMLVARSVRSGRPAVVIDPKGEYGELAAAVGGRRLVPGEDVHWPRPFVGDRGADAELAIAALGATMGRDLLLAERVGVERAAAHPEGPLVGLREAIAASADLRHGDLALALERLAHGELGPLFLSTHRASDTAPLTVLDLSQLWSRGDAALVGLAAMAVARSALRPVRQGLLVLDEAWALLSDPRVARWLRGSLKLSRTVGISHVLVLHRWSDALGTASEGSAHRASVTGLLRDCGTSVLFRQDAHELSTLDDVLGLTAAERSPLASLPRGIALARYGTARSLVEILPTADDLNVIDTDQRMR
jgi:hypothetical protein